MKLLANSQLLRIFCLLGLFLISVFKCNVIFSQKTNAVAYHDLSSQILDTNVNYAIYYSPNSAKADSIDIIYLFHGVGGDHTTWNERYDAFKLLDSLHNVNNLKPFIAIAPQAFNTYYINDINNSFPYYSFFIKEFIPKTDSIIRCNYKIRNRTVCGLSMGGYGAAIFAFKEPDLFHTCIVLSGAIRTELDLMLLSDNAYKKYYQPILGPASSPEKRITEFWKSYSPYHIINGELTSKLKNVHWYVDCGANDYLYSPNLSFHKLLRSYNIPHEFHVRHGKHEWEFMMNGFVNAIFYWNGLP